MTEFVDNLDILQIADQLGKFFNSGKIGIEKESLRVFGTKISKESHPSQLGSALCNKYITTDFSEAQIELITPPFEYKKDVLNFLDEIHHFTFSNINNDILWPFSMPPTIESTNDIPIANYGTSNMGRFKEIYRRGLAYRYGREMQSISGIHINYSLPLMIWEKNLLGDKNSEHNFRSNSYFRMLRNIFRMNWLILYLFGASPIVTKNLIKEDIESFKRLEDNIYFLPFATSLRMSNLGYQNSSRLNLNPSLNSIDEYISDLNKATNTVHKDFSILESQKTSKHRQLNSNILQIDDEYYAVARPKSNESLNKKLINKLKTKGVNYIELRSIDLNPFNRVGIDRETLLFIEIFFIYSFSKASEPIKKDEQLAIFRNDLAVAKYGRQPGLKLHKGGNQVILKDWANEVIDEMHSIVETTDLFNKDEYIESINLMKKRVNNPSETPSAKLIQEILDKKIRFVDFGKSLGESYKDYYLKINKNENSNWDEFEKESNKSLAKQLELENDSKSFEDYKEDYFSE